VTPAWPSRRTGARQPPPTWPFSIPGPSPAAQPIRACPCAATGATSMERGAQGRGNEGFPTGWANGYVMSGSSSQIVCSLSCSLTGSFAMGHCGLRPARAETVLLPLLGTQRGRRAGVYAADDVLGDGAASLRSPGLPRPRSRTRRHHHRGGRPDRHQPTRDSGRATQRLSGKVCLRSPLPLGEG